MVTMPVEKGFYVTSGFGPRWGSQHWGTDYGRDGGSGGFPVFAVKDGTVTRAGRADGFGFWVTVDHPASNGGGETVYGHVIPEVVVGQKVAEGQRIARIHPTKGPDNGWVDPHLHFEWHRFSWVPPGPNRLNPQDMLRNAVWPGEAPVGGFDSRVLAEIMGCSLERAHEMFDGYVGAMHAAEITNVRRAAMFAAQIGHESAGLRYMEEIASGSAYEWRQDLGNIYAGDGVRYKGSGPIQLTGRANFRAFTQWANREGHTDINFEDRPELVRQDPRWGFLAASWYWTQARPQINSMADAGNVSGVTYAINGGYNGLTDRQARYDRALAYGERLLPRKDWLAMASEADVRRIIREELFDIVGPIGHDVKRLAIQVGADADDPGYAGVPGWEQGGHRSLYDLVSAVAAKTKVPRTRDTLPTPPENPRNPKLGGEK